MANFRESMNDADLYRAEQDDIISSLLTITIVLQSIVYPLMKDSPANKEKLSDADKYLKDLIERMRDIAKRRGAAGDGK